MQKVNKYCTIIIGTRVNLCKLYIFPFVMKMRKSVIVLIIIFVLVDDDQ